MRGSLYPDGVNVDHVALRRTETTKAGEILRNRLNWTSRGMYSGGEITVNTSAPPPYLHIDVAQLSGFTPSGDFIQTSGNYYDIPLDDETSGIVNLVCAVYTEDNIHQQPHESDGERYPTEAEGAWRIRVYSEVNYAALPATDGNLANDAKDRCLVVGKVTANGSATSLTTSSIQGPVSFNSILYADPREFAAVPGVFILGVSSDTPTGNGTLDYTYSVGPVYDFTWTTTNGVGAILSPTVDGIYNLMDGAGAYLRVQIAISMLPTTGIFPISETTAIHNLYYQDIPRLTGEDDLHRHFTGTGVPTPTNPHGLSMNDILADQFTLLEEHQDVMHCNGIWKGSSAGIFATSVTNTSPADILHVTAPLTGDLYYVNGKKLDSLDVTDVVFATPAAQTTYFYEAYVSDEGTLEYAQKAAYPAPRTVTGTWIVDMSSEYPFGSANLKLVVTNVPPVQYTFSWDDGAGVALQATDPSQVIRLYAADGVHWVDVYVNMTAGIGDDYLPGLGTYTDSITIFVSLDLNDHIQIASISYWYDAVSATWVMGYPATSGSRFTVDKRPWGTLCVENMADSAMEQMVWDPNNELGRSGVLLRRNGNNNEFRLDYTGSGLAADINGGSYYCRGERITIDSVSSFALSTNSTSLVWADFEGTVHVLDVTATFAGDLTTAMHYILGSMTDVPPETAIYHATDLQDAPERGVILWYVETDATDITYNCDFAQNVNQVLHPWSVSSRAVGAFSAQAAYDSLFVAFEYAKVSSTKIPARDAAIVIYVTGLCGVDRQITQPSNVNVLGTRGVSTTFARVEVTHNDVGGAWRMSAGCQVIGLTLDMYADGGSVFATHNNVIVERCNYTAIGVASDAMFSLNNGGSVISGVRIRDNVIATYGGMFLNVGPVSHGYVNWEIIGNSIAVAVGSTTPAIHMDSASSVHIKRNSIIVIDTDIPMPGIYIQSTGTYQTREMFVEDNVIKVECSNVNRIPACIILEEVIYSTINGNTMEPLLLLGGTNLLVGAVLATTANIAVYDNKFNAVGVGVNVIDSFYDIEIYNNKFVTVLHTGIKVNALTYPLANSVYGLRIEGNDMNLFVKGNVGGSGWDAQLRGVELDFTTLKAADSSVTDVSVSNNMMFGYVNTIGGIMVIDIRLDSNIDTTQRNFKIDGNMMSGFAPTSSIRGIFLSGSTIADNTHPISSSSIDENQFFVEYDSNVFRVAGIDIEHSLLDSTINNNNIRVSGSDPTNNGSAIYVNQSAASFRSRGITVNGNSVLANRVGIYMNATKSIVNDNTIDSRGEGIFLATHYANYKVNLVCDGNLIRCIAYNENPFFLVGGSDGTHCICTADAMRDFSITNNRCRMEGEMGQTIPGSKGVMGGTACIKTQSCSGFHIEGNATDVDIDDVEGTPGDTTASNRIAHHIYVLCGDGMPFACLGNINGNYIDNWKGLNVSSVCHGIYIAPTALYNHANGDRTRISCVGNTIMSSSWIAYSPPGFFNNDGNLLANPGFSIPRPFEIYVPDFGVSAVVGAFMVASRVFLGGNAIMVPDDVYAEPRVYLRDLLRTAPPYSPAMANGTNYAESAMNMTGLHFW